MTYTFKLARRLAVSRHFIVFTALALLAACTGDTMAPEAADPVRSLPSPGLLQVAPRSVTIETNQRVRFQGHTLGLLGTPLTLPIAWTATGGLINPDGTFQSSLTGTFKVIGRGRSWKHADTSTVTVVSPTPDVTRIAVTPDSVALLPGGVQSFSAAGYLADGSTAVIGVNWSATGGVVDAGGTYTADSAAGTYRVIATNTAGTLADTAIVTIAAPPATLAQVILKPGTVSLAPGTTQLFTAFGRTTLGDSVAVAVDFRATGGTITSAGLYTAGTTGGTYRVVASASGLSDTTTVTVAKTLASTGVGVGIPFGQFDALGKINTENLTMSTLDPTASSLVNALGTARSTGKKVMLNLTGGKHSNYLSMIDGVYQFDMSKWKAKMDSYNTATIRDAVAKAVADGTIIGNSVMDEPQHSSWGPTGTMTKARVDTLCGYVKAIFPTLPTGVVHRHDRFDLTHSYRVCEFLADLYVTKAGNVSAYRDAGLAYGTRDGISILFGMNLLDGGTPDTDGTWDCTGTGGMGTFGNNCRMTAAQVQTYGLTLAPAGCAFVMWRYDSTFMARSDNRASFKAVGDSLAKLPHSPCVRL